MRTLRTTCVLVSSVKEAPKLMLCRQQYPKLARDMVSIHIIQSQDHILNTYSENISKYAEVRALVALRRAEPYSHSHSLDQSIVQVPT